MMEARKKDVVCGPISLPDLMDLSVLKEIIGFFGHENRMELWAEPEPVRLKQRMFFSVRTGLAIFPEWRVRQGLGIALVQKMHRDTPQLWLYRCENEFLAKLTPYFTLLAERNLAAEEAEVRQMEEIIRCSIKEYFDPQY